MDIATALNAASTGLNEAAAQLKAWEAAPGYHYSLQSLYLDQQADLQTRWLAIISFKNGVEKHWRPSRSDAIGKDEKQQIKRRMFDLIRENNNQLQTQNAYAVSKIIRFEFPNEWPELFDDLTRRLHEFVVADHDMIATRNLLIILNQTVKTLAGVRIGRARHAMQIKLPIITPLLVKFYTKLFQNWVQNLDYTEVEVCYLMLKNLRRILGVLDEPSQEISDFLKMTIEHFELLLSKEFAADLVERYAKCYCKIYHNYITLNPASFVLLPCCNDIAGFLMSFLYGWSQKIYESEESVWEIIGIKAFLVLKKLLNYVNKKGAVTVKQPKDKQLLQQAIGRLTVFNEIEKFCDLIINWYIKLKPSDLESWQLEPEEWCNEEISSNWEYQIRPCAENFFQDLVKWFDLNRYILQKLSSGGDILVQDSILCLFQLSKPSIASLVAFEELLGSTFIPLGLNGDKIIKRRVCLVLTEWFSECAEKTKIYELLLEFLNLGDKVVTLSAILALKALINDWDFKKHEFSPFLTGFITKLIAALDLLEFTESKLFILNTIGTLVERCNPLISHPDLIAVLGVVPKFWDYANANNEDILKNSLVRVLKNLIVSLNENSPQTYSVTLPLIRACCSPSLAYSLLCEDGYELWLALLQFCPSTSPDIADLFPLLEYGLLNSTEILPVLLSILRSYCLLNPELITDSVFQILAKYVPTMRDDSLVVFVALMDILLLQRYTPPRYLIDVLVGYVTDDSQSIVNCNRVLLLMARLAVNADIWGALNEQFVANWLRFYTHNGSPRNKKINLLGLLAVLNSENAAVLLPQVVKLCLLFLEEVNDAADVEAYKQDFAYEDIDDYRYLDADIKENGEKQRYVGVLQSDPAFTVQLRQAVREKAAQFPAPLDEYSRERLSEII